MNHPLENLQDQSAAVANDLDQSVVIPLVEERLDIQTRERVTGIVSIRKGIEEYHETLDVPLASHTFDIERVVLNRPIDARPEIRQDANTTIYPVVEEQLVITRQLILKEEIRVTRRDAEHRDTRTVTLHREHLEVTRTPTGGEPEKISPR